jgi:hypothetical protein
MRVAYSSHFTLLWLIILIVFGKQYKVWIWEHNSFFGHHNDCYFGEGVLIHISDPLIWNFFGTFLSHCQNVFIVYSVMRDLIFSRRWVWTLLPRSLIDRFQHSGGILCLLQGRNQFTSIIVHYFKRDHDRCLAGLSQIIISLVFVCDVH